MIRILVVDDHPIVRAGLRRIAEDDRGMTVTAEATSGEAALAALRKTHNAQRKTLWRATATIRASL